MDDASKKAALAQDIFGKSGTDLLPFFDRRGRTVCKPYASKAQDLGVVMSGEAAGPAAADFKDAQNELKICALWSVPYHR